MKSRCKLIGIIMLMVLSSGLYAQELRCEVKVNTQRMTGVDPAVFQTMQTALNEFMNNKVWTTEQLSIEERIECSMFIQIDKMVEQDIYQAKVTIQSARPIFNSTYNSPMFNFVDNEWIVTYAPNQALEFNTMQYNSNLTSLLGFYAYVLIGLDYE